MKMVKEADSRPRRKRWAPGDYYNKCCVCELNFIGDKRAAQCADCAYADWKPTHRNKNSGELVRLVYESIRVILIDNVLPCTVYENQSGDMSALPWTAFRDYFVELQKGATKTRYNR